MGKKKPVVLSTEIVHKNKYFQVRHDRLRWPNGHRGNYFIIEGSPFVIVIVENNGRFALVQQYRHTVQRTTLEFPKGGIEKGETPNLAARRELKEEIYCSVKRLVQLGKLACSIGNTRKWCYVFLAKNPKKLRKKHLRDLTEDDLQYSWLSLERLRQAFRDGQINDQDSHAAWNLYRESQLL